jgi:hypothetical protein
MHRVTQSLVLVYNIEAPASQSVAEDLESAFPDFHFSNREAENNFILVSERRDTAAWEALGPE